MRFHNRPRRMSKQEYGDAVDALIASYGDLPQITAIYDWGNPSIPGISDMDIIFVCQEDPKPLPFIRRSFFSLPGKERYVFYHPFIFISENDFRKVRHVYPDGSLRKVHGKKCVVDQLSRKERTLAREALLNDIIIRHYPRDFAFQIASKNIDVRGSLLRLNSLKYTYAALSALLKTSVRLETEKEIDRLRRQWFEHQDYALLVSLMKESLSQMNAVIDMFSHHLKGKYGHYSSKEEIVYKGIKNRTRFTSAWKTHGGHDHKTSALPIELSWQLSSYAHQEGRISEYIRKNLSSSAPPHVPATEAIEKRMRIFNNQAELAFALKHSDFPAFFDFGYRNRAGINNALLRISDSIRY